jgi:toxin ParE2
MKNVRLLPEAEREIADAAEWYDGEQRGLGDEFLQSLRECRKAIGAFPESGSPDVLGTRVRQTRRFPYRLVYQIRRSEIVVIAVAHQSRRPDYWHERLNTEVE